MMVVARASSKGEEAPNWAIVGGAVGARVKSLGSMLGLVLKRGPMVGGKEKHRVLTTVTCEEAAIEFLG